MKPKISLINSTSAAGINAVSNLVTALNLEYVDVYAFMQEDLDLLWPVSQVPAGLPRNALFEMGSAWGNLGDLPRVAVALEQAVSPAKIAAFATYLPEITSPKSNLIASQYARNALMFLVKLAALLNTKGHPIDTIEIVGGSTVDGLWRGQTRGGAESYIVNRMDESSSLTRLAERLDDVVKVAANEPSLIRLAIELEPGPLFNVCNKESLLKLCNLIAELGGDFEKVVGLNLDIPHWDFLSGITPNWVRNHPIILNRIVHAHVCDHSKGHFCDSETMSIHGYSDLVPWLQLLAGLDALKEKAKALHYSGFVSCELECCVDVKSALRSMTALQHLVDRYCT